MEPGRGLNSHSRLFRFFVQLPALLIRFARVPRSQSRFINLSAVAGGWEHMLNKRPGACQPVFLQLRSFLWRLFLGLAAGQPIGPNLLPWRPPPGLHVNSDFQLHGGTTTNGALNGTSIAQSLPWPTLIWCGYYQEWCRSSRNWFTDGFCPACADKWLRPSF